MCEIKVKKEDLLGFNKILIVYSNNLNACDNLYCDVSYICHKYDRSSLLQHFTKSYLGNIQFRDI